MPEAAEQSSESNGTSQLYQLVPVFDPAVDSVEAWSQKISILLAAWPSNKLLELSTRIVLNTKGSAFQKLQLRQKEIFTGTPDGVKKIVAIVGGTFGQIPLERKYEMVEKALYRCQQRVDESADSYLARTDVVWSDMLARSVSLEEVQAYTILRGSRLQQEDKKRVLVESGAEKGGSLEMSKVNAAVRMLGSNFFQEYTSGKKEKTLKTYDETAFSVEENPEERDTALWMSEDTLDEETIEAMAPEDEDAAMVLQFEGAIMESVQEDPDLCAFFSSYQEARRRLVEKTKARGFFPVQKGGKGKKGFKGKKGSRKSLSQRIAESYCKLCHKQGHWKAECPSRTSTGDAAASNAVPVSFAMTLDPVIEAIPEMPAEPWTEKEESLIFGVMVENLKAQLKTQGLKDKLRSFMPRKKVSSEIEHLSRCKPETVMSDSSPAEIDVALFASSGTVGVVDLGASKTVIGSKQVPELIANLPKNVRASLKRTTCNLVFRFGNHQTLNSRVALMLPLQDSWFRIAVVEGNTPFLLSSQFLKKTLRAVIDVDEGTLWSKNLNRHLELTESQKDLFLMDINQLWNEPATVLQVQESPLTLDRPREKVCEAETSQMSSSKTSKDPPIKVVSPQFDMQDVTVALKTDMKEADEKVLTRTDSELQTKNVSVDLQSSFVAQNSVNQISQNQSDRHGIESEAREVPCRAMVPGRPRISEDVPQGAKCLSDRVWRCQERPSLSRSLRGLPLDQMVCQDVREIIQSGASEVPEVHLTADGRSQLQDARENFEIKSSERTSTIQNGSSCELRNRGGSERSVDAEPRSSSVDPIRRSASHGEALGVHGGHTARSDPAPSIPDNAASAMDGGEGRREALEATSHVTCCNAEAFDFGFLTTDQNAYSQKCSRMINQFRQELQAMAKIIKPNKKPTFMFEVMCSEKSELTRQCWNQNLSAKRFCLQEGDLSTSVGRRNLLAHLLAENPENLWMSPVCRPWCRWSLFNMSRSESLRDQILRDREKSLWQISLAVVLLEFQVSQDHHFHFEQPEGSQMLLVPSLNPVLQATKRCCFDLCTVGDLRDPVNQKAVRKRLIVHTTSEELFQTLVNRKCTMQHEHSQIAGSTVLENNRMPMSQFTELYPRKFARQIVQALKRTNQWSFAAETEEHPSKRRRVSEKSSQLAIALRNPDVTWEDVMHAVDALASRVGVKIIEQGDLIDAIQRLSPDYQINHVVLCRGTDRMLGPCKPMLPGQAPFRKMICIRRRLENIYQEDNWERWENLSARQLRRKTIAARCNLTIFGKKHHEEESANHPEEPAPKRVRTQRAPNSLPNAPVSQSSSTEQNVDAESIRVAQNAEIERHVIDLQSNKHGPDMLALKPEERNWILKIHRNMGHPGIQKLQTYCQQIGCDQRILRAIPHIKCSTCEETKNPHIPRPSSIHENLDFGDVISTDGVTFVNQKGKSFHFYHFIDHGTNFQTAFCSPARTPEAAIRALTLGWINWAGPPNLLCLDSAGEFTSGEYEQFLQRHDIKLRMIPPESHWQNAKAERHGGILQEILEKMDKENPIETYEQLEVALALYPDQESMEQVSWFSP